MSIKRAFPICKNFELNKICANIGNILKNTEKIPLYRKLYKPLPLISQEFFFSVKSCILRINNFKMRLKFKKKYIVWHNATRKFKGESVDRDISLFLLLEEDYKFYPK